MDNLTQKQREVLQLLVKTNQRMTVSAVVRELKAEKALISNILQQLADMELVKKYGAYDYIAAPSAFQLLGQKVPTAPRTRKNEPMDHEAERKKATQSLASKEKAALTEQVATDPDPAPAPEPIEEHQAGALAGDERPDFKTLVMRGLVKLNAQLGLKQHSIADFDLKIDTLGQLAESVGQVDASVQDVLLAVIADLQAVGERSP